MKTFFYNLETGEKGEFRNEPYTVDGQPGVLPAHLVELTLVEDPYPNYSTETQYVTRKDVLDLSLKEWRIGYTVNDLTQEEIEAREDSLNSSCTPKQFRLALLEFGIDPDSITSMIQAISDPNERKAAIITWEYAVFIEKDHPLIKQFASILGVDRVGINQIFARAQEL